VNNSFIYTEFLRHIEVTRAPLKNLKFPSLLHLALQILGIVLAIYLNKTSSDIDGYPTSLDSLQLLIFHAYFGAWNYHGWQLWELRNPYKYDWDTTDSKSQHIISCLNPLRIENALTTINLRMIAPPIKLAHIAPQGSTTARP
jgi:hypothetical protein